jgi:probable HAF family extracellular repeat protein
MKFRTNVFVIALLAANQSVAATPSFTRLGDFPGGPPDSVAYGVSADGAVVSGFGTAALGTQAFRWTAVDGLIALGDLPGGENYSLGGSGSSISADGQVVVGYSGSANSQAEAFRWTPGGGMVGLGTLVPGGYRTVAWSVSGDGNTVVGYGENLTTNTQAFRWTAASGMAPLSGMLGAESIATGASFDGSVIVGYKTVATGREAFRWTATDGPVGLGFLRMGDFSSEATAVTPDGSVVIGTSSSPTGTRAFRWTAQGGMIDLGNLGTPSTYAMGLASDGKTIVGTAEGSQAFIWTESDGMSNLQTVLTGLGLDLGGLPLRQARSVSADGLTIVGVGGVGAFQEAWVATIPEPSSFVLVTLAMVFALLASLTRFTLRTA